MNTGRFIIGLLFITFGLSALFDVSLFRFIFPIIIIFIGLLILSGRSSAAAQRSETPEETHENYLDYTVIFNGINKKIISSSFSGGKVHMVFGGGEIDLRNAKIAKGKTVYLEVNAIFGGAKIIVPKNWTVSSSLVGVFGGFSNATKSPNAKDEQGRLVVKGSAVFGGGEVVNS